jgi:hypothetical protein
VSDDEKELEADSGIGWLESPVDGDKRLLTYWPDGTFTLGEGVTWEEACKTLFLRYVNMAPAPPDDAEDILLGRKQGPSVE